jgi:hypothetical protein
MLQTGEGSQGVGYQIMAHPPAAVSDKSNPAGITLIRQPGQWGMIHSGTTAIMGQKMTQKTNAYRRHLQMTVFLVPLTTLYPWS